jgi:mannosyl-glycoprotein endo-beta-N-acetylglucosaminidase
MFNSFLSSFLPTAAADLLQGFRGVVVTQGGNLNLRSAPSLSAPVVGSIPNGATVVVLGEQNGFYNVVFGGQTGFASANFITVEINAAGMVATSGGNLNLRSAPNATAPIVGSLPNGTAVTILGDENGFYRVLANGQTGYVSKVFVMMPANATGVVATNGGNLNLRSAPNATAPIVGTLPNGTTVAISGEQNGFYRVVANGRTGWASFNFIAV